MTRWFAVESADERVFTSAPYVFRYERTLAAPPAAVWESLSADESLSAWSSTVLPVFKTFAEDYVVEPHGPDGVSTRFTWTVAIEPKSAFALPFKALGPVLKLAFGRMAADGERHFARAG
jgi:hypothetical protein